LSGKKYIAPFLAEKVSIELEDQGLGVDLKGLSEKERQIIKLMGTGKSLAQIATVMEIKQDVLQTYRVNIINALRSKINAEQVLYSIIAG